MKMKNIGLMCLTVLLVSACAVPGFAGWDATILDNVMLTDTTGTNHVGYVYNNGQQAGMWDSDGSSFTNLNPLGYESFGVSINGNQQAGYATASPTWNGWSAVLWTGSDNSMINLGPGQVFGIWGDKQVGRSAGHAALWSGTAQSYVDLNPTNIASSTLYGIYANDYVGDIFTNNNHHAALWHGGIDNWVDLNPDVAIGSTALCAYGSQQGGEAIILGRPHAALWSGTAASFKNLSPEGGFDSRVLDMTDGIQVGYSGFNNTNDFPHAGLWRGDSSTWLDLHTYVADKLTSSKAFGVSINGDEIWVVGEGSQNHGVIWHYTPDAVPEPSTLLALAGILPAGLVFLKRKKA